MKKEFMDFFERFIWKITSGRFIFTIIVALVFAYLAVNGKMQEDRINEITLIVLYAYFNRPRVEVIPSDKDKEKENN